MKKIFTLVATALCAMGANAQGYSYTLTDADVALTQELINTIAGNAGGTSAEIIIPGTKGTVEVYGLSEETGEKTGVSLPDGFSVTIKGEGEKPTLSFPKSFNIEGNHDYINFENIKIADGGCQYFINQSKAATVNELSLKDIEINGMDRSLIRVQGSEVVTINNINIDNCVMTNMASGNSYAVIYFKGKEVIGKIDIKNSTFNTSQHGFIAASNTAIANGVFISDCTFYNNVVGGRYFMDANGKETNLTMTNVILGKTYEETAKGIRTAGTQTYTNCLRTSDCIYASNNIADLPAGEQSSADIFTNPDNGDFTLKIDTKVGDPRWYGGTSISNAVVEKAAADAPAYNLAGQKVNDSFKGIVVKNGKKVVVK